MSAADQPGAPSRACPFCGYELRGLGSPTVTCPECGRASDAVTLDLRRGIRLRLALTLLAWSTPVILLSILVQTAASNGTSATFSHPWWLLLPASAAGLAGLSLLAVNAPVAGFPARRRLIVALCFTAIALANVRAGIAHQEGGEQPFALGYVFSSWERSVVYGVEMLVRALWDLCLIALLISAPQVLAAAAPALGLDGGGRWLRRAPLIAVVLLPAWIVSNAQHYVSKPFLFVPPSPPGSGFRMPLTQPEWLEQTLQAVGAAVPILALGTLTALWIFTLLARAHLAAITPPRPPPAPASPPSAAAGGTPPARP